MLCDQEPMTVQVNRSDVQRDEILVLPRNCYDSQGTCQIRYSQICMNPGTLGTFGPQTVTSEARQKVIAQVVGLVIAVLCISQN